MDATKMQSLLARVEAATGPNREIDESLARLSDWSPPDGVPFRDYSYASGMPHYTTSIDAALALVERMLPEWIYAAGIGPGRIGNCVLGPEGIRRHSSLIQNVTASTPPLAILAALLRALLAQQEHAAP